MKLTIIYHVYSDTKTLEKSLSSLMNQTNTNYELIIIDDYASVEAKEILNKFDLSNKNISIIRLFENYGRSFSYNLGIEKSKGKYVYFAEAKNIFSKDFVETILACVKENNYDYINFKIPKLDRETYFKSDCEINKENMSIWLANSSLTIRNKVLNKKFLETNKISFINYKNMYPIFLYEIVSSSKKAYFINKELLKMENKNTKSDTYSYNLYDILESTYLLANKINEDDIDDQTRDNFEVWLPKLCLCEFLYKMFESYDNEKVLNIAIDRAWETIEKIDSTFKSSKSLNLIQDQNIKDYIKNFKPTYNYVKKHITNF